MGRYTPKRRTASGLLSKNGFKIDRKTGLYAYDVRFRYTDITGKQRPSTKTFHAKTDRDAQKQFDTYLAKLESENTLFSEKTTLADLVRKYIEYKSQGGITSSTIRNYEAVLRNQIQNSTLGKKNANKVRLDELEMFYNELQRHGSTTGGPLSSSTVHRVHVIIYGAYEHAIRYEWLTTNPAQRVSLPKNTHRDVKHFETEEIETVIAEVEKTKDENLISAVYIALFTGMRLNEIFALTWKDIIFTCQEKNEGYISVKKSLSRHLQGSDDGYLELKSPKSKSGIRNVTFGPKLYKKLVEHKNNQAIALGRLEIKQTNSTPVLSNQLGQLIFGDKTSGRFSKILRKLGFDKEYTFHSLRHTHCTILLQQGAAIETVSKRVGHADSTTTLKNYSHVMLGQDEKAAEAFDNAMEGI